MSTPPAERRDPAALPRLFIGLLAIGLLWPGLRLTEFSPATLFDPRSSEVTVRFLRSFFPLETSGEFLRLVGKSTLETLAMATAGSALAVLIGFPLALIVTRRLSISAIGPTRGHRLAAGGRMPARGVLLLLRSVPEIVWALLLVRALGLGPAAAVLAIAINYGGMLGKVYHEIFESVDGLPTRAILEAGSGRLSAFFYGTFPLALPEFVSYSIYRWECAVRASAVMGFVGAGGLGQQLELSMRMLSGGEVSTILLVFFTLVLVADGLSAAMRRMLA
jgi:phosphonate transport system permease protein